MRFQSLFAVAFLLPGLIQAATILVSSTANDGPDTLRQAFLDAEDNGPGGDTILFAESLAGQTINLSETIIVTSGTVTVNGGTISAGVTLSGGNSVTIFRVEQGATLNLFDVNLTKGRHMSGPGAVLNLGTTTVSRCALYDNEGSDAGAIHSLGNLQLTNCTLSGNSSNAGLAGAISSSATCSLTNCTITANTSTNGAAVMIQDATTTTTNCIIAGDSGFPAMDMLVNGSGSQWVRAGLNIVQLLSLTGGGTQSGPAALNGDPLLASLADYGGLTLTRPPLPGSPAIDPAGGASSSAALIDQRSFPRVADAYAQEGAILDIGAVEVATVVTGTADTGPASLRHQIRGAAPGQTLTISPALSASTIQISQEIVISRPITIDASGAPGFTVLAGTTNRHLHVSLSASGVEIRGITFRGGGGRGTYEDGSGGSIANQGTLILDSCQFFNNSANLDTLGRGGAIYSRFGTLTVRRSTFSGNSSKGGGGAIWTRSNPSGDAITKLEQSTFSGNSTSASGRGGAIYNFDGRTELTYCTISGNNALTADDGGGVASFGDTNTLTVCRNCILAGNGSSDVSFVGLSTNSFQSLGSNLVGSGNAIANFGQTGDVSGISDPQITALGDYGGPTQTRVPLPGSPAIDSGDASPLFSTDQRGASLPIDGDGVAGAIADIGAVEADVLAENQPGDIAFADTTALLTEAGGTQTIQVRRTGGKRGTVQASIQITLGTTSTDDFAPLAGATVVFRHGESTATAPFTPVSDPAKREGHEFFTITLENPTNGSALTSPAQARVFILDAFDRIRPTLAISSPRKDTIILESAGPVIAVTGTARDDKGVADVALTQNGAVPPNLSLVLSGDLRTGTWSQTLSLVPGLNQIAAASIDFQGNRSVAARRTIDYRVVRNLTVTPGGSPNGGTVQTAFSGSTSRSVGIRYTISAKPKPGFIFQGWTANDFTGTGVTTAAQEVPVLTFTMREGLELQANFMPNPFVPAITGVYQGLVRVDSGTSAVPAGNVTTGALSAKITTTGAFSGRILIDGSNLPFSGVFHHDGTARFGKTRAHSIRLARKRRPPLVLSLAVDMGGGAQSLSGSVTQTLPGNVLAASTFTGYRAAFSAISPVPAILAGTTAKGQRYNVITSADSFLNTRPIDTYPQGSSVGRLIVTPEGKASWTLSLADGSSATGSALLSKDWRFPLYSSLYKGGGCFTSWVTLDTTLPDSDLDISSPLWFRPQVLSSQYYPSGWADGLRFSIFGTKYVPSVSFPQSGVATTIIFEQGKLTTFGKNITFTPGNTVLKSNPLDRSYTLSYLRATGELSGTFTHNGDGKVTKFIATTLQRGGNAGIFGYFLTVSPKVKNGLGESGYVSIIMP